MKVAKVKIYTIKELSPDAQQVAIKQWLEHDFTDINYILDEYKIELESFGFYDVDINYAGFYSQGDGASFTAGIDIMKFLAKNKKLKEYKKIIKNLDAITFNIIRHNNHYYHEHTTSVDIMDAWDEYDIQGLEDYINQWILDFNIDIYKALQKEYEYLTYDNNIINELEINEIYFTVDGLQFNY